jgi:hypothetical protein
MTANKQWIVTTSGDRPLHDIAKDLKNSGFKVGQILDEIGCITGEGGEAAAERLRDVPGVTDVSANLMVDIGPPDADETW